MVIDNWKGWMLEARDIYPQTVAGWTAYEETLLTATREIEEIFHTLVVPDDALACHKRRPFDRHAAEVRHVLVAVKLICAGVNPYDPALTRDEWIAVANAEVARYSWALDHAHLWATNLGYAADYPGGGTRLLREPPPRPILKD